jgi:hypothetical protein
MSIQQFINQNSYVVAAVFLALIAFFIVSVKFRQSPFAWAGFVALLVILIAVNLALRVSVSEIETTAQFDLVLAANQPVVLEIYSNY